MRTIYALRSLRQLKRSLSSAGADGDYWQAGRSVAGITSIEPVASIFERFAKAVTVP